MANVFDQFDEVQEANVFDQFDEQEEQSPESLMATAGQAEDTGGDWNTVGAAKDVGKLIYDLPTQVKGAIGNLAEDADPLEKTDWKDRWAKEAEQRTAQRKSELEVEGGAKDRLIPFTDALNRGDIADTSSSMGFSAVSMVPSAAGGLLATTGIGAPAGIALGMAGSGAAAYNMDKTMFTRQLLEKTNNDLVGLRGTPMTDAERKEYLAATDDVRSDHALWEAGPEAVGNAIGMFGMGKIFSGVAKKQFVKAAIGEIINVAGEVSTEIPTQMGQQRDESNLGLTEEAPRQWGSGGDWWKSAKEVTPQVVIQSGLMGSGSAIAGKVYSQVKADPVEEIGKAKTVDDAINAANAAVDPEIAPQASPVQFSDEDKATHLQHAQSRLEELERKKNGTPDQEIQDEDGTVRTIPGEQPNYLTDAEKQELKWLWLNGNDQEAIAKVYGFEPTAAETTPEVTPEVTGEVQPDAQIQPDAVIAPEGPLRRKPQVTPQVTPLEKQPGESWAMYLKRRPDAIKNAQEQNGQRELPAVEEQPAAVAEPVPTEAARTPEQSGNPGQLTPEVRGAEQSRQEMSEIPSKNVGTDTTGAAGQQGSAQPARAGVELDAPNVSTQSAPMGATSFDPLALLQNPNKTSPKIAPDFSEMAVGAVNERIAQERADVEKWKAKKYKPNSKKVSVGGTSDDLNAGTTSVGAANSRRRLLAIRDGEKRITALESAKGRLDKSMSEDEAKAILNELSDEGILLNAPQPVAVNETPVRETQTDLPVAGETNPTGDKKETVQHAGLTIYSTALNGEEYFAVQIPENKGTSKQTGDTLHKTIEEAKEHAEVSARNYADREQYRKEAAEEAKVEAERKEANKGKTIAERRADAILDKPHRYGGLPGRTRRELFDKVASGELPGYSVTSDDIPDPAAKKRDEEIVESVRNRYMLSPKDRTRGSNPNIPEVKAAYEAIDRIEAGYTKKRYRLTTPQGSFYDISKTEHDYGTQVKETAETLTKPEGKEEKAEQTDKERQDAILAKYNADELAQTKVQLEGYNKKTKAQEKYETTAAEALADIDEEISLYEQIKGCIG